MGSLRKHMKICMFFEGFQRNGESENRFIEQTSCAYAGLLCLLEDWFFHKFLLSSLSVSLLLGPFHQLFLDDGGGSSRSPFLLFFSASKN